MDINRLRLQLRLHEGTKKFPYVDTAGKTTIGVGRNLTDKGISNVTVNQMLLEDIEDTLSFLHAHCPWFETLDDVRQRAIADITFNLMGKLLMFKHMIAAMEAKEWDRAANELLNSEFALQVGKRAKTLAYMLRTGTDVLDSSK